MGNRFTRRVESEEAEADPPSLSRPDLPILPFCFEEGGPSSPPEVIKYVIPETVVLVTRDAEVPEPVPEEPLRAEEEQEDELEERLSRYEQGLYRDDYQLELILEGGEEEEEFGEMLEIDPVVDAVLDEEYNPETDP